MVPNDHAIMLFKFGEQRWMDKIIEGNLSFSCVGAYIQQYKRTGNEIQGDPYEAVFARVKKHDHIIAEMQELLGNDLELIDDNDFMMLRRRSAKYVPVFCVYGYKGVDVLNDIPEHEITIGKHHVIHEFDERMYSGFSDSLEVKNVISDSHRFTQLAIRVPEFMVRLYEHAFFDNIQFEMHPIDYKTMRDEEFFIEPNRYYKELFYKFPRYSYQIEARITIPGERLLFTHDRRNVKVRPFYKNNYYKAFTRTKFNMGVIIKNS